VNPAIARVYFVNEDFGAIDIPEGFRIYDLTNDVQSDPFPGIQEYVLAWSDNYQFFYNNQPIIQLNNQRQWSIQSTARREVRTIEQ